MAKRSAEHETPSEAPSTGVIPFLVPVVIIAILLFCCLAYFGYRQYQEVVGMPAIAKNLTPEGELRELIQVTSIVRAMDLVTAKLASDVETVVTDERWRGTASARVVARVRYLFGTDLSQLERRNIQLGPVFESVVITIPEPVVVAVEVDLSEGVHEVTVTGTRIRSRAGEYMLGLARLAIYREARERVLSFEQQEQVRVETRARVSEVAQAILGPDRHVEVEFSQAPREHQDQPSPQSTERSADRSQE